MVRPIFTGVFALGGKSCHFSNVLSAALAGFDRPARARPVTC
jgi:hypothetical protein